MKAACLYFSKAKMRVLPIAMSVALITLFVLTLTGTSSLNSIRENAQEEKFLASNNVALYPFYQLPASNCNGLCRSVGFTKCLAPKAGLSAGFQLPFDSEGGSPTTLTCSTPVVKDGPNAGYVFCQCVG
jgi:hypothetical protein